MEAQVEFKENEKWEQKPTGECLHRFPSFSKFSRVFL